MTGFYTMSGARCNEFSEFAGVIHSAKVNPGQVSAQQDKAGGSSSSCAIVPGAYTVTPPASMTTGVTGAGKALPYDGTSTSDCAQAAAMRRCPILVRAAMVASCPSNPTAPVASKQYVDGAGKIHCSAAASIQVHVNIQQIYEVAGMPKMTEVDTVRESTSVNAISIESLIQAKAGLNCPDGTNSVGGTCMGCPAGCGGPQCKPCTLPDISFKGEISCHQ